MATQILVIGATGKTGAHVVDSLQKRGTDKVQVYAAIRKKEQEESFTKKGIPTRHVDLDNPDSYSDSLKGIDCLFLLTAYTVDMLAQSKNLLDAAKQQGVKHIVHVGTFNQPGRPMSKLVDHFIWRSYIEVYIEHLGFGWTHLHPNVFNQNLPQFTKDHKFIMPMGDVQAGWIDARDIAEVAAEALSNPSKYNHQHVFLSTEALSGADIAKILAEESGTEWKYEPADPVQLGKAISASGAFEPAYLACVIRFFTRLMQGQLPDGADVYPDVVPSILGRKPFTLRDYVRDNRVAFK